MRNHESGTPLTVERMATFRVARFYLLVGSAWFVCTDGLLYLAHRASASSTIASLGKGLFFVVVTAAALYLYITRRFRQTLHESDTLSQRLSRLSRYANDIVLLLDKDGNLLDANDRAAEAFGYPMDVLRKMSIGQLQAGKRDWRLDWNEVLEKGDFRFETCNKRADETTFPVEISARRIDIEKRTSVQAIIRDISERKAAEQQIIRLKDVYAALSQTNQCLIRISNREEFFQAICDITIQYAHFSMAWIGLINHGTQSVTPVAKAGPGIGYLEGLQVSTDPSSPLNRGPIGRAITTGQFQIFNDFDGASAATPWHQKAVEFKIKSSAAFPISSGGQIIGAISLYACERDYFTQDLIDLLCEMAMSISHALDRMLSEAERQRLELELIRSNARIQGIIEGSHDIIAAMDTDLRFTLCNRAYAERVFEAVNIHPQPGMAFMDCFRDIPDQLEASSEYWKRALSGERVVRNWSIGLAGDEVFFESYLAPLLDPAGKIVGAFHIGRDITAHRKMESDLQKLSTAVEQSPVTVVITDLKGDIEYVNPAFTTSSGYSAQEVTGKNPRIMKSGRTSDAEYVEMWQTIVGGSPWVGQFHNKRKDGSMYWEEAVIAPIRDKTGAITNFIGIKQDVTIRREAEERANFLAEHDPLTRLPNRRLGRERMEEAMRIAEQRGHKAALLFIDLDHFKKVNDSLSHSVGDHLLQALVQRLQSCIRHTETLSRLGGDEFLIIVPWFEEESSLASLAARILEKVVAPFHIDGFELSITVSIGVAIFTGDGQDYDSLFAQADTAMYHAKRAGRNTFQIFTEKMKIDANEYLLILNGLRKALDRKEFILHYQPQVLLSSNDIIGVEALIRWNHPELGLIPPGRFIPIAEDSGLIVEIGEWVLRQACRQAEKWQKAGYNLTVAVNLSAVQFRRGNLPEIVSKALKESNLDPSCLELELTESILIEDTVNALSVVQQLRALGVRLSLDDFGTGYSNLAYLRRFKLDKLKIDRSFVMGILSSQDDDTLAHTIIHMAQTFGLKTIAEGVENIETLEVIREYGCDEIQGFYIAKPMPPEELEVFLVKFPTSAIADSLLYKQTPIEVSGNLFADPKLGFIQ